MEEQAGRQVLRAGFLEVVAADGSLLPVWAALEGLSPLHDLRPEWSDGLLLLYSDSRVSCSLGPRSGSASRAFFRSARADWCRTASTMPSWS